MNRSPDEIASDIKMRYGRRHNDKLAMQADMVELRDEHSWTQPEIATKTGVPQQTVSDWLRAHDEATDLGRPSRLTPESKQTQSDRAVAKRVIAENPAVVIEAFEAAPPETQREIAREISKSPTVRLEAQKLDTELRANYRPTPVRQNDSLVLMQFESKLASAYGSLRKALGLLEKVDQEGDDEDVLFRINQLRTVVEVIDETYRTGKSLDTWANELWEEAK